MTIIHPISDMFTRIRNALKELKSDVEIPYSKSIVAIASILKDEGFIEYYETVGDDLKKKNLKIGLKYTNKEKSVISSIKTVSKPSKRVYVKKANVPKIKNGYGICIISTSSGILSGQSARLKNVGGELIGVVY